VIKSANKVTKVKYPNADDVLVDDYIYTKYNTDGTSVTWDDTFIKVLTEKGRRDNKTISFYFSLPYSTVKVIVLEVIKPNGKVIPIKISENAKIMVENSQIRTNIYNPNNKILKVNIPSLNIGDVLRYVSCRKTVKPRVRNTWSDYYMLEYTSPIKKMSIEILGPASRPLQSMGIRNRIKDTVHSFVTKEPHAVRYKWIIKDVPRMFTEPNMPPLYSVVQRLLVSTIPKWQLVSSWYWDLCRPHLKKITPEMRDTVKKITKGIKGQRDRIKAVFKFVSQKIRYMGITTEKESPGYEPHDVNITFENKYGVCRDKASLLVAMLRIAGFKAYPVLINNGPKKDPDIPNPYFNHAIVGVETLKGDYILMDPTDENTRDLFPAYLCNQSYLVAKPEGDTLRVSSIIPASKNLLKIKTDATLSQDGILIGDTDLYFEGINDSIYRGYFARHKPAERKKFFEKVIKKVLSGAKLVDLNITPKNIRNTTTPLKVHLRYIADNILISGSGKVIVPPLIFGNKLGVVNFVLGKTGLEKRRYPLVTDIACGISEKFTLDFKNALGPVISIPKSKPIMQKNLFLWRRKFKLENKTMTGFNDFQLLNVEYSPAKYLKLKNALKKIEFNSKKVPIFFEAGFSNSVAGNASSTGANVLVLSEVFKCKVKDNTSWSTTRTVKKKILSYAGKKSNSEIKISYNPLWETVNVKYAKVTAPDGTVKNISKNEINIMDQDWVGNAPRYAPGKIMVLSLPGVDVGVIIEYQIEKTYKMRPFFSIREYITGFDPIVKKSFSLDIPGKFPLRISILNGKNSLPPLSFKNQRKNIYSVTDINLPALKMEKDMPPLWSFARSISLSTGDWEKYSATLNKSFKKLASTQRVTALRALKITKGKKSELEKVKAIKNYVAESIQMVGPGLADYPISKLSQADKTLVDGYGNNPDVAILLYAMLKAVNINSEFILVSDIPAVADLSRFEKNPQFDFFSKVILKTTVNNKTIYLNDSDQYAELGTTPSEGKFILPLNTGKFTKLHLDDKYRSGITVAYQINLDASGKAQIIRKRTFSGANYASKKKQYAEITSEDLKHLQMEMTASISQSAKLEEDIETDFKSYPGYDRLKVSINNFAVPEKKYLYLKLPEASSPLFGEFADNRANPVFIPASKLINKSFLLNLPEEFAKKIPIAPQSASLKLPENAGTISIINDHDIFKKSKKPYLFISENIKIHPAVIGTDNFDYFKDIIDKVQAPKNNTILLEKENLKIKKKKVILHK
jgi:transglutaminase-like putative cysteine protease